MRKVLLTAVAIGAIAAAMGTPVQSAASECLLDTNNDGDADSNVDTTGNANDQNDNESLACGISSVADPQNTSGDGATAIGSFAAALGPGALAIGNDVIADGIGALAIGGDANGSGYGQTGANGDGASAIGVGALAGANDATAAGSLANASATGASAFGADSLAQGVNSTALGINTQALGDSATAIGVGAEALANTSTAVGLNTQTNASGGTAVGTNASTTAGRGTAVGFNAVADSFATAVGQGAQATGRRTAAIGNEAVADFDDSTALGANATTTAANQVTIGGTGSSVRIGDIDASTGEQVGPIEFVTVDANGVLGRQSVEAAGSVTNVQALVDRVAQVSEAQFNTLSDQVVSLEAAVSTLDGRVDTLFDLSETIDRDAQRGIASIAAQANPHFPSAAGKTSYASNVATYRGEVGFSAGLMHRFEGDFAITAGVTYAGGNSTSVRAGVAGEF